MELCELIIIVTVSLEVATLELGKLVHTQLDTFFKSRAPQQEILVQNEVLHYLTTAKIVKLSCSFVSHVKMPFLMQVESIMEENLRSLLQGKLKDFFIASLERIHLPASSSSSSKTITMFLPTATAA